MKVSDEEETLLDLLQSESLRLDSYSGRSNRFQDKVSVWLELVWHGYPTGMDGVSVRIERHRLGVAV